MGIEVWVLLGAGALAGIVGSAGGTSSLITYPVLLAAGLPALLANVTNAVAYVASWPGSALGSRPELHGQGRQVRRLAPFAAAGGAVGAALLLFTPGGVFAVLVPFLVAFAALALLVQPWVSAWQERRHQRHSALLLPLGLFAVTVYDGYWGAGAGVMILALVLLTTADQQLTRSNALKNMLLGVADAASAIGFAVFGPVDWAAALPLAAGLLIGSSVGPAVARRVPARVLRVVVALAGLGFAGYLWAGG